MLISSSGQPTDLPDHIETPFVLIDEEAMVANLRRGAEIAARQGCAIRPHIKTHKSVELGRLQMHKGAAGITTSKADETLVFVRAGFPSITCAYPLIDRAKISRLLSAARAHDTDLRFISDSPETIDALEETAQKFGIKPGVFLKLDVGLGRVGLEPTSENVVRLADRITRSQSLNFQGLLSHAGHGYGAVNRDELAEIAEGERRALMRTRSRLEEAGLDVPELSVGSTPTVMINPFLSGLTEVRPGNYIFFDMTAVRLGVCSISDVALAVCSTVVSVNQRYAIIDAGSKVLSSDQGAHGLASGSGFGTAFRIGSEHWAGLQVQRLSEEHGFVMAANLKVGDRLLILPNHSCAVVNLVGGYTIRSSNGALRNLTIEAKSLLQNRRLGGRHPGPTRRLSRLTARGRHDSLIASSR